MLARTAASAFPLYHVHNTEIMLCPMEPWIGKPRLTLQLTEHTSYRFAPALAVVLAYIDNTARASHSVVFIAYTCIDAYED